MLLLKPLQRAAAIAAAIALISVLIAAATGNSATQRRQAAPQRARSNQSRPAPRGAAATTEAAAAVPSAPAQTTSGTTNREDDDVAITATVTARELTFEVVPNPRVEFFGSHERKTAWEAERRNLPRPVRPGETYRDIGVRLRITSVFADIDRIVAEALGETPTGDDDNAAPPPRQNEPAAEEAPPPSPEQSAPPPPPAGADADAHSETPRPQASVSAIELPTQRAATSHRPAGFSHSTSYASPSVSLFAPPPPSRQTAGKTTSRGRHL